MLVRPLGASIAFFRASSAKGSQRHRRFHGPRHWRGLPRQIRGQAEDSVWMARRWHLARVGATQAMASGRKSRRPLLVVGYVPVTGRRRPSVRPDCRCTGRSGLRRSHRGGQAGLLGGRPLEYEGQLGQLLAALDAAELALGGQHPRRVPAQRQLPRAPALHPPAWSRMISIIDSIGLVEAKASSCSLRPWATGPAPWSCLVCLG